MVKTCVDGDLPRHSLARVHGDGAHGGGWGHTYIRHGDVDDDDDVSLVPEYGDGAHGGCWGHTCIRWQGGTKISRMTVFMIMMVDLGESKSKERLEECESKTEPTIVNIWGFLFTSIIIVYYGI